MPTGQSFNPGQRAAALAALGEESLDLLVLGGGITGAGAALDSATRGLHTGLIEAGDLACGTSSKSSKLLHGGLRYLEMFDFGLVREALRERDLLMNQLAPHLVRPVPFLFPFRHRVWERLYLGAGLFLYDRMGGARSVPRARHFSRRGAKRIAPALRSEKFAGAVQFYDAQEDDARLVLQVARTAAKYGAKVATRVKADELIQVDGVVCGVRATDLETGERIEIKARRVVSALGPWTERFVAGAEGAAPVRVRPSKGIHILIERDRLDLDTGVFLRTEKSVLFVIPWGRHWLIGDTDTDWLQDSSVPAANRTDVEYLLGKCNEWFEVELGADDVVGVIAGLRPLVASDESQSTTGLSREHSVDTPAPGLVTVSGGKLTTYRVMAKDVVDAAVAGLSAQVPASCTGEVPIFGAEGYAPLWNGRGELSRRSGLDSESVVRLLGRYGSCIETLLTLILEQPELAREVPGGEPYLAVEVVYACRYEGALHLEDVLTRRTRISMETFDRGTSAAEPTARLMSGELGWDQERQDAELEGYLALAARELAAERQPDDESALKELCVGPASASV